MLARNELAEYLLDNYGECERGEDCYWGKNAFGRWDGCLRTGWKGRLCKYWKPLGATDYEGLKRAQQWKSPGGK